MKCKYCESDAVLAGMCEVCSMEEELESIDNAYFLSNQDASEPQIRGEQFDDRLAMYQNEY